jgi:hypothetical protein
MQSQNFRVLDNSSVMLLLVVGWKSLILDPKQILISLHFDSFYNWNLSDEMLFAKMSIWFFKLLVWSFPITSLTVVSSTNFHISFCNF